MSRHQAANPHHDRFENAPWRVARDPMRPKPNRGKCPLLGQGELSLLSAITDNHCVSLAIVRVGMLVRVANNPQ